VVSGWLAGPIAPPALSKKLINLLYGPFSAQRAFICTQFSWMKLNIRSGNLLKRLASFSRKPV
jgi:hypothetical protein